MYLLDTNLCIAYMRGKNLLVKNRMASKRPRDLFICTPVLAELRFGALYSSSPLNELAKIHKFISRMSILTFDEPSVEHYANIRVDLTRRGVRIPDMDLEIASIALAYNLILVTHNTADFSRITGLKLEDWEIP